jgi:hypothetical protein
MSILIRELKKKITNYFFLDKIPRRVIIETNSVV